MTSTQLSKKIERAIRKAVEARKEAAELFQQAQNNDFGHIRELAELLESVAYSTMGSVGEPITKDVDKSINRAYDIVAMKNAWAAIREMAKEEPELEQRIEDARWSSDEQRKIFLSLGYMYINTEHTPEMI